MKEPIYTSRWPQLAKWWDTATITKPDEVNAIARRLVAAKDRYQKVEAKTGVPWWIIAAIHQREASQNWDTQLAQGDPLHKVSTHVPKGMGPFDTWEDGAIAALKHDGLTSIKDWGLEKALHCQEKYNGWGYFYRGIPSPYVWAGTSIQRPGKFVADGQWSPSTMDRQLGCAAILKGMMAIDPGITPARESAGPGKTGEFVAPSRPAPAEGAGEVKGTGLGLLNRAQKHIGEEYVNIQIPKDDSKWTGPWDCAEFISWLVYQEAGILYGCVDDNAEPSEADAYTGAWRTDVERLGNRVSVEEAASTVGGIVLRYPPPGGMGHIALCDGKGGTVEAKGRKYGVVADTVHGRTWHTGVLIPGIKYDSRNAVTPVKPPADLYARNAPNMESTIIVKIQEALASKGFSPGGIDGEFGPETEAAVVAFQLSEGLVADGQVGRDTADALGISLTGSKPKPAEPAAKPAEPAAKPVAPPEKPAEPIIRPFEPPGLGVGTMNPLIMIAARMLPGIIGAIAGDKVGTVAGAVTKAVTDIAQTKDPDAAEKKLKADPDAYAALQFKLAEIAADQEEKRQQAQLALLKEQNEQEIKRQQAQLETLRVRSEADAKKREAEFKELQVRIEDTKGARSTFAQLALASNPMAWGAPFVSGVVAIGFFGVLIAMMLKNQDPPTNISQLINISVGALAAGFATVISFWLGSSQGSRAKDAANVEIQERQAKQTEEIIAKSAKQNAVILEQSAKQNAEVLKTVMKSEPAAKAEKSPKQLERCLDIVLKLEGVADRGDTKFGITLEELKSSRNDQSLAEKNLMELSRDDACEFYRMRYWNVLKCDELPIGVDLVVFDLAADLGVAKSIEMLQEVVGAKSDGSIGPVTMGAVALKTPQEIVTKLSELRRDKKRGSGEGTSRINEIENAAVRMITAESAVAV